MEQLYASEEALRLLMSVVLGMIIGLEREWREKAAGLRTLALVSLGSATFMIVTAELAPDGSGRAAAGVITGIGFLGAGAIIRERGEIIGLTTAAAVWMAAALGMAAAVGDLAVIGTVLGLSLLVLLVLPAFNIENVQRDARAYQVVYKPVAWDRDSLGAALDSAQLKSAPMSISISEEDTTVVWRAIGRRERHDAALAALHADERVRSVTVT